MPNNQNLKNIDADIAQTDPDFFYREAITELGRLNDRRFARAAAIGVFTYAILYFLTH